MMGYWCRGATEWHHMVGHGAVHHRMVFVVCGGVCPLPLFRSTYDRCALPPYDRGRKGWYGWITSHAFRGTPPQFEDRQCRQADRYTHKMGRNKMLVAELGSNVGSICRRRPNSTASNLVTFVYDHLMFSTTMDRDEQQSGKERPPVHVLRYADICVMNFTYLHIVHTFFLIYDILRGRSRLHSLWNASMTAANASTKYLTPGSERASTSMPSQFSVLMSPRYAS